MNDELIKKINTGIATVLSAIFPGLGQFFNGKLPKGFIFFILGGILFYRVYIFFIAKLDPVIFILKGLTPYPGVFVLIFFIVLWVVSIIDANKDSKL